MKIPMLLLTTPIDRAAAGEVGIESGSGGGAGSAEIDVGRVAGVEQAVAGLEIDTAKDIEIDAQLVLVIDAGHENGGFDENLGGGGHRRF